MKLRLWAACLLAGLLGAFSILPGWAQSDSYQYIDIRNPFQPQTARYENDHLGRVLDNLRPVDTPRRSPRGP